MKYIISGNDVFVGGLILHENGLSMYQAHAMNEGHLDGFVNDTYGPRKLRRIEAFAIILRASKEIWNDRIK